MAMLSYMAATTSRVTLATSVLVLPYHNPVELAKYAATLDQMSGGRVTLGVGAGAMTEEFEALGIPMRQRGSLTNECIAIMKELWTNHSPEYHSRRWDFGDLRFSPKPVQRPHIPLWIGGSSPGAMRRTARVGDGWHPTGLSPEDFAIGRKELSDMATAAGRDPASIAMSARIEIEVHGGPSSQRAASRARLPGDDAGAMRAGIEAYREAGVEHVVLALNSGDVPALRRLMATIADEVLPTFR
jgi:probable F420-dependent oxidoreductase